MSGGEVLKERDRAYCCGLKDKTCALMRQTSRITLRAHHVLCHFCNHEGATYPQAMWPKIIEETRTNPALEIRIVAGLDDVCYCCPRCVEHRCRAQDGRMWPNDLQKDQDVLRRLRLHTGSVWPAKELFARVAAGIPRVAEVCADGEGPGGTHCKAATSGRYEKAVSARWWER